MKDDDTQQKLQAVCDSFGIGTLRDHEEIAEGVLNRNYRISTDKGAYFVKGIRGKRLDSIGTIAAVERYMGDAGIPAIAMLTTRSGDAFADAEGERFTVYPFVESDRSHAYSVSDYSRMGEMLARIHLASSSSIPPIELKGVKNNSVSETIELLESYKQRIESKESRDDVDALFLEYINLKLDTIRGMQESDEIGSHRTHLLHGDYHAGNLLIEKETREIVGICDWEKAELGSRAYEIARSALLLFEDFANELDQVRAYIQGYASVYPVSREELVDGFVFRAKAIAKSRWIEDFYYNNGDSRSNKFVAKDMERMRFFMPVFSGEDTSGFFDLFLH